MSNGGEDNTPGRPKSDDFGRAVSRMAVAQICESVGFHGFKESALDSLSDITIRYLCDLAKIASFYANLSGASISGNCLVNSGTIKEIIDFVGSNDEIPFAQPVPRFPVIRVRKLIPSFESMSEAPPGKHIPAWLPALPDPHTYLHTPMWNERAVDPRAEKIEQARQRRKAERALLSLQQRLLSNGSAGASSLGVSNNVKELGVVESNQFLATPLESGKKDVSQLYREEVVRRVFGSESLKKGEGENRALVRRVDERDDKKRRAEYVLRQSNGKPTRAYEL
ncbi:hypothetical protein H0E87_012768 [Populus deltoides]|uniref:Transcription initiation factor TFIID subunit 8 n=1 Tax=Populus deltoides TaxID=3696 RepID=A0A8T2YKW1_POPDE|nr:hypothetical protein H0E87_012768 [Populus deltoides]